MTSHILPLPDLALVHELAETGLFDAAWYASHYPDGGDGGIESLVHFVQHGLREYRRPNLYFDVPWYHQQHPDITAAGIHPVLHYARFGDLEGRRPHPLVEPDWYRRTYGLADGTIALRHFLIEGRTQHRLPGPDLFAVQHTRKRSRMTVDEACHAWLMSSVYTDNPSIEVLRTSRLVDPSFYILNGQDVHEAGVHPDRHYAEIGWREHRRPNHYFDPGWYITTNSDLQAVPVNPLLHYILVGEATGRRPVPWFDPSWYRAAYNIPPRQNALAHFLAHRHSQKVSPSPLFDVDWYVARHRGLLGPRTDPFAHYLHHGTLEDIDPSPDFNAASYRKRHIGRPSRAFATRMQPEEYNPLVHYLIAHYIPSVA